MPKSGIAIFLKKRQNLPKNNFHFLLLTHIKMQALKIVLFSLKHCYEIIN